MSNVKKVDFGSVSVTSEEEETHKEGKVRCLDMLAAISGKDTQEIKDLKDKAHFDAKNRF